VSRRSALLLVIREAIPFRSHPSCDVQLGAEGDIFAAAPGGPDRIGSSLRRRLDALWTVADNETIFIAAGDY